MAQSNLLLARTFKVSSDSDNLSAATDQFIFVHASDADQRVSQAYANDKCIGVSQETAKKDEGISVGVVGITKLRMGGACNHGELLKPDASGNAVRHLGDTAAGAMALQDGANNDVIEALIVQVHGAT